MASVETIIENAHEDARLAVEHLQAAITGLAELAARLREHGVPAGKIDNSAPAPTPDPLDHVARHSTEGNDMPTNWRNGPNNRESYYSPDERDAEWAAWWAKLMKRQTERSET